MRRAWLTTVAAAFLVAATQTDPAAASPSGMSLSAPTSSSASSDSTFGSWTGWTKSLKFWDSEPEPAPQFSAVKAARPSEEISPWRHPIRYFQAAMSETPVANSLSRQKAEQQMEQSKDSISLSTPTGPAKPQFYISTAQLAERQGNVVEARRQLQKALKQWPNDVEILRAAARMEDRQGQLPLAESLYQRAVTANPQHAGALNDLGLCLARQGKLQPSIQAIEQAIHLQPDKALYRNNAATVLVEMRQDQKALAHLSAVHSPAVSNYNLGKLLVERGRTHEAYAYFQMAAELDPTMEAAHAALAQLNGTPVDGPQLTTQPVGEPTFPSTARGPKIDTSSRAVPVQYPPAGVAPTAPMYQTATSPRYLPPVRPAVPGGVVR